MMIKESVLFTQIVLRIWRTFFFVCNHFLVKLKRDKRCIRDLKDRVATKKMSDAAKQCNITQENASPWQFDSDVWPFSKITDSRKQKVYRHKQQEAHDSKKKEICFGMVGSNVSLIASTLTTNSKNDDEANIQIKVLRGEDGFLWTLKLTSIQDLFTKNILKDWFQRILERDDVSNYMMVKYASGVTHNMLFAPQNRLPWDAIRDKLWFNIETNVFKPLFEGSDKTSWIPVSVFDNDHKLRNVCKIQFYTFIEETISVSLQNAI